MGRLVRVLSAVMMLMSTGCDAPGLTPDARVEDHAADAHLPVDGPLTDLPHVADPDAAAPDPDAALDPIGLDGLRALIDAHEAGEIGVASLRAALRAMPAPDGDVPAIVEGTLLVPAGDHAVGGVVTVAEGAMLVLAPGARLTADGIDSMGRLYAIGGIDDPVRIDAGGHEIAVHLRGGPNAVYRTELSGAERLIVAGHTPDVRSRIAHTRFDHWGDVAIDLVATGAVEISHGIFGLESAPDEGGEVIRARRSGFIHIADGVFGPRRGYRDAIDLQDCVGDAWPLIEGNHFADGEDDAIDLDRCSAFVIGNHIRHMRPIDLAARRAGINGGGITGDGDIDVIIVGNVIDGCYHGIGFKNGARPVMVNNTVVDSHIGVSLYQSAQGQPSPHGTMINNLLSGNRDWLTGAPQDVVLNGKWWPTYNRVDDVQATLDAEFNTFASGGELPPGEGNDARDPMIERIDELPVPAPASPAIDSGRGAGLDPMIARWLYVDFRGHARTRDGDDIVDIDRGAIER